MKKTFLVLLSLVFLFSIVAIIYADEGNNSNNESNDNNTNISCVNNTDCSSGYNCEDGFCVLGNNENNETEENDTRICCKVTSTIENLKNIVKYHWDGEEDCITTNTKMTKEIVDNNLCKSIKEAIIEKNRIKFEAKTGQNCTDECICTGVVMKCTLEDGTRQMTVYARSGNIIFQVKGINATTNVTLYHHNNKTYANFSNKTVEIILPDQVQEKIKEKRNISIEQENISLDENGIYQIEGKKKSRFFFIFPVKEKFNVQIDAETGQIIKFRNPWWGFLARDIKEK